MDKQSKEWADALVKVAGEIGTFTAGHPRDKLPWRVTVELRNYVRARTSLTKTDEELTNEEGAWKIIYLELDKDMERLLGVEKKRGIDIAADRMYHLGLFTEAINALTPVGIHVEELFLQQGKLIAYHHRDEANEYKIQVNRVSDLMWDKTISHKDRKDCGEIIIKLATRYREVIVQPLQALNDEIGQELSKFGLMLRTLPAQNEIDVSRLLENNQRWLSLSVELNASRIMTTDGIIKQIEVDTKLPTAVIANEGGWDVTFSGEEVLRFNEEMEAYSRLFNESNNSNTKIQEEREPLARKLFGPEEPVSAEQESTPTLAPLVSTPSKSQSESKKWYRLLQRLLGTQVF